MISRDERLFFEATLPKPNSLTLLDIIIVNHLLPLIEIIRNNFLHPRLRTRDYFPLKITGMVLPPNLAVMLINHVSSGSSLNFLLLVFFKCLIPWKVFPYGPEKLLCAAYSLQRIGCDLTLLTSKSNCNSSPINN